MTKVIFGITCKNASLTIGYVLKLLLMQEGDFEKFFVVVDGGSNDNTPRIVREILSRSKVQYIVESGDYTIPEGRNRVLNLAMKENPNYILLVDADVVFKFRNFVGMLLSFAKELSDDAVICVPYKFLHFNNHEDAKHFMDKFLNENEYLKNQGFNFRPVAWGGLGLTLLPQKVGTVRFDNDLTFREDRYFGLEIWKRGFGLYKLIVDGDLAFDVNIGAISNIYFSMNLKNYFKGFRKKVAIYVYSIFSPSFVCFIKNVIKNIKVLYHAFYTVLVVLGILTNIPFLLWASFTLILLYILLQFRKSRNPVKILAAWAKFYVYSIILAVLLIPIYLEHKREYQEIYQLISSDDKNPRV